MFFLDFLLYSEKLNMFCLAMGQNIIKQIDVFLYYDEVYPAHSFLTGGSSFPSLCRGRALPVMGY